MQKYIYLFFLFPIHLFAQNDTIPIQEIPTLTIEATRIPVTRLEQPFAISTYQADALQETRQQLSLQEYISHLPGLFSLNANNFAQDLRISIRGFGARSAFGIRGIKLIVDGIPETTPDGQGQIDNLNLGVIEQIEVLKGPSSALYGNASGGVVNIRTLENVENSFVEFSPTLGAFNLQQYQLKGAWIGEQQQLIAQATHTRTDGYRAQSGVRNSNVNLRFQQRWNDQHKLRIQFNITDSPIAEDAGSLTLEEVKNDRRQARDRNVLFQTSEAIQQWKLGSSYDWQLTDNQQLTTYAFYSQRDFEGRLPFENGGWINLDRDYFGQGISYRWDTDLFKQKNTLQIGYDVAAQRDDRRRFLNEEGEKGNNVLNQLERFQNVGLYALNHWTSERWILTAGLRYDWNKLAVEDQIDENSSNINLTALNPSIGFNYLLVKELHLYGNYRSSFETPSLSELSANPNNETGFNESLQAQEADNYEIGIKGALNPQVTFDATVFHIRTQNDLVPFELTDFPNRTFFRNAGATDRTGTELLLEWKWAPNWAVSTAYTFSDFRYRNYQLPEGDFEGNELSGIPKHLVSLLLSHSVPDGLALRFQTRYLGDFYAEDANAVNIPAATIVDISAAYPFEANGFKLLPVLGINNVLNVNYFDNIRLNAFGNRFYEPAAGANLYGGVRFRIK